MISGLIAYYFGWIYVLVVFVTVLLYVWFTFWASERRIAIRRDMNNSDTEAHSKAVDSLLNYETVKYFGNEELEARRFEFVDGALREGGDPHLQLARPAQYRPGGDLHARHGGLHAARRARRDQRRAHRRRFRDDQRDPDAALSAAQLHGHGLSRDQAGPDRHRDHVRAAARAGGDRRPAGRQAAPRQEGRGQVRERLVRLRSRAADPEECELRGAGGQDGGHRRAVRRRQIHHLAHLVPLLRVVRRPRADRRPEHQRRDAGLAARGDRHGAAGHGAVQRHHRVQHPLRQTRCEHGRGARGGAARPDRRLHYDAAARLSLAGRRTGLETCPAARSSGWRSPAPSSRRRRS